MKNNSKEMKLIRKKIDQVDDKLLPLMVKRSKLVEKALSLKKKKTEIVDKKRIDEISKKIVKKSIELGGNSKLLKSIWLSIIKNFIDYENREFKKK
mgnify:FL=1|tara:strand:- start:262 stop:549 length:288 start_codon:yes stop_codon:yes gene_type:complete